MSEDVPTEPARPLEERLAAVPTRPGVYLLKDRHGKVIYVGKAVNLRARVRTYLRGGDERTQMRFLVERLAEFETLVTANEKEALILENNLIKQYRPRYNIRLKDDKSYVSVKVTMQDAWPRVLVTRRLVKDGGRYFGPFHSASAVRESRSTTGSSRTARCWRRSSRSSTKRTTATSPTRSSCRSRSPTPACARSTWASAGAGRSRSWCRSAGTSCASRRSPPRTRARASPSGGRRPTAAALAREVVGLQREMREAARELEFERAAQIRDRIRTLETRLTGVAPPELG